MALTFHSSTSFYKKLYPQNKKIKDNLEINYGFSNGEIALQIPVQIEELGRDELEDFIHIYVVFCTREK